VSNFGAGQVRVILSTVKFPLLKASTLQLSLNGGKFCYVINYGSKLVFRSNCRRNLSDFFYIGEIYEDIKS
jgi:hypothetical protein